MSLNPFTDHPSTVDETYFEHMRAAFGFGTRMVLGGVGCLLHGLFPFLSTTSGSDQVRLLHRRMVTHRKGGDEQAALSRQQAG